MKRLVTFIFLIAGMQAVMAQSGIDFFHGTFEEAVAEAKNQDKIIFVDAFAIWCGPCKRMSATVFTDPAVGEFYNKNFISLKMDMERGEGLEFRKKYPITAYPTLFFIDYTGDVVTKGVGALEAESFINLGKQALSKIDRSGLYATEYEKGSRDPKLMLNYVRALNKAGKPSLKIANEYLRSQTDLTSEDNLRFILEAASECDTKAFDLLIQNMDKIKALCGEKAIQDRIQEACQNTAKKAIEFQSRDLLTDAQTKMKQYSPATANSFTLQSEMDFSLAMRDFKSYLQACKEYIKKEAPDRPAEYNKQAMVLFNTFPDDEKARKQAEDFAKQAAHDGKSFEYYFNYAGILYENNKKEEALKAADKALELARQANTNMVRSIEALKRRIEEG